MPQTLKKLKVHIALGLSIRLSVHLFKIYEDTVLKFHILYGFLIKKELTHIFLKSGLSPFVELCPKGHNDIL